MIILRMNRHGETEFYNGYPDLMKVDIGNEKYMYCSRIFKGETDAPIVNVIDCSLIGKTINISEFEGKREKRLMELAERFRNDGESVINEVMEVIR